MNLCNAVRSHQSRPRKKNLSAPPGQITLFSAVFPLFIEDLCGVGCLSQDEGGAKEKILKEKESPTGRAPQVVIPSWRNRTLRTRSYRYDKVALIPNGHLCHNLSKVILIKFKPKRFSLGSTSYNLELNVRNATCILPKICKRLNLTVDYDTPV